MCAARRFGRLRVPKKGRSTMVIKIRDTYYNGDFGTWTPCNTASNYLREPSPQRSMEMWNSWKAALAEDEREARAANPCSDAEWMMYHSLSFAHPRADAVAASYGDEWTAMRAYDDWRQCEEQTRTQVLPCPE